MFPFNEGKTRIIRPTPEKTDLQHDFLGLCHLFGKTYLSDVVFVFASNSIEFERQDIEILSTQDNNIQHTIPAHRLVLALRSNAFRLALLRSKSSQLPERIRFPLKIHIQDTSFQVFSNLLRFLYTDEILEYIETTKEMRINYWKALLQASVGYVIPSLVHICVNQLLHLVLCHSTNEIEDYMDINISDIETKEHTPSEDMTQDESNISIGDYFIGVLEILVFCDQNLMTQNTLTQEQYRSKSSSSLLQGAEEDLEYTEAVVQCMASVKMLEDVCMTKLEEASIPDFEHLLTAPVLNQCSTDRLCSILRRRSTTPLVLAINYQLERVVHALLQQNEPLESKDGEELPLAVALKTGNDSIIRRLLVDADDPQFLLKDKIPRLYLAVAKGNLKHCQVLVDIDQANVNEISPLENGDTDIYEVYGRGQTALHISCRKGYADVVSFLLSRQAVPNLQDCEGNTALHYASSSEIAEILLKPEYRTNPNIPNMRGQTPLHVAAAHQEDVSIVVELLKHGAKQDVMDEQGQCPFHVAASSGNTSVALVLLHENANLDKSKQINRQSTDGDSNNPKENSEDISNDMDLINLEDYKNNTALHLAAMSPHNRCEKMLKLLLENGADPNRTNWFGYTPLHLFCSHQSGPSSVIDAFVENGADVHMQSADGSTPLHLAVGRASEDVAVALVMAGARVNIVDAAGRSVVDLAQTSNQGILLLPILRNVAQPPETQNEDNITECSSCHTTFYRLTVRKYYCQHCGCAVCYNCSTNKIAIPKFNITTPVRVCETCYGVLSFRRLA